MKKMVFLIATFFLASGCTQKVQKYNQSGHLKFLLQEYTKAIADYTKVLEIDPINSEAYFGRGLSNANLNKNSDAIADYTKVIEINPKDAEAYRYRGYAKYDLADFRGAIADFSNVININSKDELVYFTRIDAKRKLNDYKGVIEDFTKIIEFNPKKAESYINRGNTEYENNYYPEAIFDYISAIEINNKSALSLCQNIEFRNKFDYNNDYYITLTNFININPNRLAAYLLRGIAKLDAYNNQISYAIADFDKAIEIDPKNSTAYTLRGYAKYFYWKQKKDKLETKRSDFMNFDNSTRLFEADNGNKTIIFNLFKELIGDFKMAIAIDPKCAEAYRYRGNVYDEYYHSSEEEDDDYNKAFIIKLENYDIFSLKKSGRSIDELSMDKLTNWQKEYVEMKIKIIKQLSKIRLKDTIGVLADYTKVVDLNPNFNYLHFQNGAERIRLQYFNGVIIQYNEVIVGDPKDVKAYFLRGNLKSYIQDYSGAIADYTKVIQLDPKNEDAYYNRTCAKFNLQDYRGAVSDFTKIIEINPKNAEAYYKRGLLFVFELGQKDNGCMDFSTAGGLGFAKAYEAINEHCQLK